MMKKATTTFPYEFYAYQNSETDKCPECGSLPRDYHLPSRHWNVVAQATFECAFGHKWLAPEIELIKYPPDIETKDQKLRYVTFWITEMEKEDWETNGKTLNEDGNEYDLLLMEQHRLERQA